MRASLAATRRHDVPPSSERQSPTTVGPTTYIRCALVFIATATVSRPDSTGRPPPLTSFHVTPWSVDLYSAVPLVAAGALAVPALPVPRLARWMVLAGITLG